MEKDDSGASGFMEAMVAVAVVSTALMIYLSAAGMAMTVSEDHARGFDLERLDYDPDLETLTESSISYIRDFVDRGSGSGVSVSVVLPGTDKDEYKFVYGDMDGPRGSDRKLTVCESQSKRSYAAIIGVTVCGRTRRAWWHWWMP